MAIANLLQRTATEPELSLAFPPGRESAAELRVRLGYGGSDPNRTGGIIKYLMEVLQHCPTLLLVSADNKGRTLPLGNAGTANAAVVWRTRTLSASLRAISAPSVCCASWKRRGVPRPPPSRPRTCGRHLWPCACPRYGRRLWTAGLLRPLPPLASAGFRSAALVSLRKTSTERRCVRWACLPSTRRSGGPSCPPCGLYLSGRRA